MILGSDRAGVLPALLVGATSSAASVLWAYRLPQASRARARRRASLLKLGGCRAPVRDPGRATGGAASARGPGRTSCSCSSTRASSLGDARSAASAEPRATRAGGGCSTTRTAPGSCAPGRTSRSCATPSTRGSTAFTHDGRAPSSTGEASALARRARATSPLAGRVGPWPAIVAADRRRGDGRRARGRFPRGRVATRVHSIVRSAERAERDLAADARRRQPDAVRGSPPSRCGHASAGRELRGRAHPTSSSRTRAANVLLSERAHGAIADEDADEVRFEVPMTPRDRVRRAPLPACAVRFEDEPAAQEAGTVRAKEATLANNARWAVVDRGAGRPPRAVRVGTPELGVQVPAARPRAEDGEVDLVGLAAHRASRQPRFTFRDGADRRNQLWDGFDNRDEEVSEQVDEPVLVRLGTHDEERAPPRLPGTDAERAVRLRRADPRRHRGRASSPATSSP